MPIYTFRCRNCEKEQEHLRTMGDNEEPLCPWCCYNPNIQGENERMHRVITHTARPHFKVDGFYETDYKHWKSDKPGSTAKAFDGIRKREQNDKGDDD